MWDIRWLYSGADGCLKKDTNTKTHAASHTAKGTSQGITVVGLKFSEVIVDEFYNFLSKDTSFLKGYISANEE